MIRPMQIVFLVLREFVVVTGLLHADPAWAEVTGSTVKTCVRSEAEHYDRRRNSQSHEAASLKCRPGGLPVAVGRTQRSRQPPGESLRPIRCRQVRHFLT